MLVCETSSPGGVVLGCVRRLSPPEVLCWCLRGDFLPRRCCAGVRETFSPGGVVLVCVRRLSLPEVLCW